FLAADAAEALDVADRGTPFDLLFTDIVMSGSMNGRQLAERMIAGRPSLRVLFTSGYAYGAIHAQGRAGQGIPLLTKPYRKAELARMLRRCLDPAVDSAGDPIPQRCALNVLPISDIVRTGQDEQAALRLRPWCRRDP